VFLGKFKMAVMAYLADSSEKTRTDRPAKRS
jgi:hypothetical protein